MFVSQPGLFQSRRALNGAVSDQFPYVSFLSNLLD
jgi:hypothetical protein